MCVCQFSGPAANLAKENHKHSEQTLHGVSGLLMVTLNEKKVAFGSGLAELLQAADNGPPDRATTQEYVFRHGLKPLVSST
jgi:hypothetical protein